jgi:predicted phage tail protein
MESAMRVTTNRTVAAAIMVIGLAAGMTAGFAQNRSSSAPSPPSAAEQDLVDLKKLAEEGARLKRGAEDSLRALDEKQRVLDMILKDIQSARQFVDDLMKLLKDTADRLGPESSYAKTLQAQEELVRGLAGEASSSRNTADRLYGDQLDKQASVIAGLRGEARDLAAKLAAEIDRLDRSKSQLRFAFALRSTDAFIKTAREYLDAAREVVNGAADLATRAERIAAPTVPTQ